MTHMCNLNSMVIFSCVWEAVRKHQSRDKKTLMLTASFKIKHCVDPTIHSDSCLSHLAKVLL